MLIAKCCVTLHFSGAVCILATPLCCRMQNDWTPIEQVTAQGWLLCHSELDLLANSVSSQPWLVLQVQQYKTSQWRVESGQWNQRVSCHHFQSVWRHLPPKILSMRHVVGSTLSVNKIWIPFGRKTMIYLNWILTNLFGCYSPSVVKVFHTIIQHTSRNVQTP